MADKVVHPSTYDVIELVGTKVEAYRTRLKLSFKYEAHA